VKTTPRRPVHRFLGNSSLLDAQEIQLVIKTALNAPTERGLLLLSPWATTKGLRRDIANQLKGYFGKDN
jgi:hypothetical protein